MKKNLLKRCLCLAMSFVLVAALFTGCNGNGEGESSIVNGGEDVSSIINVPDPNSSITQGGTNTGTNNNTNTNTTSSKPKGTYSRVDTITTIPGTQGTPAEIGTKYELIEGDFCIIKGGQVMSTIVVSAEAPTNVYSAATDLAFNLKKMTGKTFEVKTDDEKITGNKILVGKSKYTDAVGVKFSTGFPGTEDFQIISSKNILILGGNDTGAYKGSQFAVTYLLESMGFGWFGTEDIWNIVPSRDTAYVTQCDVYSKASFSSRYTRLTSEYPTLGARWYNGGGLAKCDHALGSLLPIELYQTHPEYFGLSMGTRNPAGRRWWQPCFSNTGLQDYVASEVIKFFKENPLYTMGSIGQNDGEDTRGGTDYAHWCECSGCQAMGATFQQQLIKFANIIGNKIKKECPGKTIMIYGYFMTYDAPSTCDKPADNIHLMLCKHGGQTRFIRNNNLFTTNKIKTQFSTNFNKWRNLGFKNIAIYEWNCPGAASNKWKECFWVQGEVFIDNAKWLKQNGVDFINIDQGPNSAYERGAEVLDIRWPLWYVNSIAMWNCNLTFEEIMMPACEKLFGDAAEDMYKFYKILNDANKNCNYSHTDWVMPEPNLMYPQSVLTAAESAISKAKFTANLEGGDYLTRVSNQFAQWNTMVQTIRGW